MTENPPLFIRKEGDFSFDRVFLDVVHVDLQFLKGFGEFLFALGHVEGDPETLVWVVGGGSEDFAEGPCKNRIGIAVHCNVVSLVFIWGLGICICVETRCDIYDDRVLLRIKTVPKDIVIGTSA